MSLMWKIVFEILFDLIVCIEGNRQVTCLHLCGFVTMAIYCFYSLKRIHNKIFGHDFRLLQWLIFKYNIYIIGRQWTLLSVSVIHSYIIVLLSCSMSGFDSISHLQEGPWLSLLFVKFLLQNLDLNCPKWNQNHNVK